MAAKKTSTKIIVALALIAGSFLVSLIVSGTKPFRTFELKWLDQLFELRGPINADDSPIVLVSISEETDSELPFKYPYPTGYYARLIENLNKAGAKVIGFDIIFNKADVENPQSDSLFAKAIQEAGNVILAGNINNEKKISFADESSAHSNTISLVDPYHLFQKTNPNPWGFVSVAPDQDAFVRKYIFSQKHLDNTYYAFGLEVLREYNNYGNEVALIDKGNYYEFGDYLIEKTANGLMQINYIGGPKSYPQYDMSQVIDDVDLVTNSEMAFGEDLNGFDDPEFGLVYTDVFRDKIVIIGNIQVEFHDFYATPYASNGNLPGYEIHANAIQTILSGKYIYDIPYSTEVWIILLLAVYVVFVTRYTKAIWGALNLVLTEVGFLTVNIYLFVSNSTHLEFTASVLVIILGYVSAVVYDFLTEQKEKRRIKNMFSSYVSPDLVEKMIESGEEPKLGGDEVHMTAFFSDIQSFSTFSEKLEPKQLVDLINEYLSAMTDILTDEGGTLDKYIGDAIVAFFGAPLPLEDHAYRACRTAIRIQNKQAELRDKWTNETEWPEVVHFMMTRIGLNTGLMVTGNMGSSRRFNYTMMGDNVNLAARCESGAKSFGVYTMVTEETKLEAEKFGSDILFRYLDKIIVKGRSIPVSMYEVVGFKKELTASTFECVELYEAGMKAYAEQDWDKAIRLLKDASKLEPWQPQRMPNIKDNPSLIMLERCEEMKLQPVIENWDGVYVMKTK
ncbi:adenylate/guanylate cyclase domain-containing protein [bacterium]|nr:MAG: adenylate/guanylate cyclase domain-containing protein [bacterium]